MKTSRMIGGALRALGRYKVRSAFGMLGTLVGVSALTVVVAVGRGTQQEVLDSFARVFSGSRIMLQGMASAQHGAGAVITQTLTLADIEAIEAAIPAITVTDPMQYIGSGDFVFEGQSARTAVRGHSERYPDAANRGVTRGSFFSAADVRASARVGVVGESLVERVFGDIDPIGQTVRIGTIPVEIIGVLEPLGLDPHGIDRDHEVIIPISTMMRRVMNVDYLNSATLAVDPAADLDATVDAVHALLRERHALADGEPDDFRTWTPVQVERMIESSNRVFTVLLPAVAFISILVGTGVVANLMWMGVSERRHEIGLRKAVGARPRDIWWQFVVESALVTTVGGVAAVALGMTVTWAIASHTSLVAAFPWKVGVAGLVISVGAGVVAGVLPARRAAGLDPVNSLR